MKIVIFGLSISSSWGNGHATLWRGLCRALGEMGHRIIFFEKNVPYYAAHRDASDIPGVGLILYPAWAEVLPDALRHLSDADVGIVTSYCPDGIAASKTLLSSRAALRAFYDLDSPVTLERIANGEPVAYIGENGLRDFDLVLSYTGGAALSELKNLLGARCAAPLYGSVDPSAHYPVSQTDRYRSDLSYLGTYAADRQPALEELFVEPARHLRDKRFLIGGPLYPPGFPWRENIFYVSHLPPGEHPSFYCSSSLTLNITRGAMARMGYCPSGRLFEAAACGVPIISDHWEGLERFFEPGRELIVAQSAEDVAAALDVTRAELARMAAAARERCLEEHTSARRAAELVSILNDAYHRNLENKHESGAGAELLGA